MTRLSKIDSSRLDAAIAVIEPLFDQNCERMIGHLTPPEHMSTADCRAKRSGGLGEGESSALGIHRPLSGRSQKRPTMRHRARCSSTSWLLTAALNRGKPQMPGSRLRVTSGCGESRSGGIRHHSDAPSRRSWCGPALVALVTGADSSAEAAAAPAHAGRRSSIQSERYLDHDGRWRAQPLGAPEHEEAMALSGTALVASTDHEAPGRPPAQAVHGDLIGYMRSAPFAMTARSCRRRMQGRSMGHHTFCLPRLSNTCDERPAMFRLIWTLSVRTRDCLQFATCRATARSLASAPAADSRGYSNTCN